MSDRSSEDDEPMLAAFELRTSTEGSVRSATPQDDESVLLLKGKNAEGEDIYAYLRLPLGRVNELQAVLAGNQHFMPSDFGTVLAAGRGEPSEEVQAAMAEDQEVVYFPPQRLPWLPVLPHGFTPTRTYGGSSPVDAPPTDRTEP